MAETVSLAVLENLVHMARQDFPTGYVLVRAVVPDEIAVTEEDALIQAFGHLGKNLLGDLWLDLCPSAVLGVRSAVVPFERNFLLNPRHPDFGTIEIGPVAPFVFDQRLFGAA